MYIVLGDEPDNGIVYVTLPMPPDFRTSFSGSAMPFPSEDIAFDAMLRPTRKHIADGSRVLHLVTERVPNWYYRNGIHGPPFAKVAYHSRGQPVETMHEIQGVACTPGRSLTAQHRIFTNSRSRRVMTQNQALMLRGMPGHGMCRHNEARGLVAFVDGGTSSYTDLTDGYTEDITCED